VDFVATMALADCMYICIHSLAAENYITMAKFTLSERPTRKDSLFSIKEITSFSFNKNN